MHPMIDKYKVGLVSEEANMPMKVINKLLMHKWSKNFSGYGCHPLYSPVQPKYEKIRSKMFFKSEVAGISSVIGWRMIVLYSISSISLPSSGLIHVTGDSIRSVEVFVP